MQASLSSGTAGANALEVIRNKAIIASYETHAEAEKAVHEIQKAGFDMKRLSIVGKDYQLEEEVVGYYTMGDRMKAWGKSGAFWGGIWGFLFGSAFFFIPGFGPLLVAGPLIGWIVGALEGAAILGGLSVIGAGLVSIGIPKDSIIEYETQIKAGKFLVIAHGSPTELENIEQTMRNTEHSGMKEHLCCG